MSARRDLLRRVWIAGALLLVPAFAFAQAAAGVDTKPPSSWRFQLSADGTWYENAYFVGVSDGASSWSASGQASLSRERRFKNGSFTLSGFGGALYYPEIDDFNQPTYGGSFTLKLSPSRRTKLHFGQSYSRSNTRSLRTLDIEGLPLPTSSLDNATSTASLSQNLSQRIQLALDGSYTWRRYDDERLTGGEQLYGTAQLGYQLGREGSIYLGYGYSASWLGEGPDAGPERSHQLQLGGRKQKDRGVGFELAAGAGYVERTGTFYPAGRAGLTARGRRSSLSLLYYRDFGQAFGYGRQTIGDIATASLGWTPVRRITFNASYNFGYRRDPQDESYTIRSDIASAGFGWDVGGGVGFGASYSWERNETQGQPLVDGGRASASLSYGVDWQ